MSATKFYALGLKSALLALPAALLLAASPAHAIVAFGNVEFQAEFGDPDPVCTLNADSTTDCVILGIASAGTGTPIATLDSVSVTGNADLSILSYGCAAGGDFNTPCDVVVQFATGAYTSGSLAGELSWTYTTENPRNGDLVDFTVDPPISEYLSVELGDPSAQGSSALYGSNGAIIGNSADVTPALEGSLGISAGGSSVPAPMSLGLLMLGLAGASLLRRRSGIVGV